ncbi:MAG TPA: M1 family metallopeptidase [Opitutaceae bacterium]|nr:M1 family metallopeptidase [Opitutaceae bacterium]
MPLRRGLLLILAGGIAGLPGLRAEKPFTFADTPGQLPKSVVPRHYALRLAPDFTGHRAAGTARIEVDVLQPVRELVLNARDLRIISAGVDAGGGDLPVRVDAARQTLTVALPAELAPGPHVVTFTYVANIGTQAQGLFLDRYPTASGDKLLLGTQMEPTDARRVFPCWDEPVYRATYDITLVVPDNLMAVSNMPIRREVPEAAGRKAVTFERTPAMASYLVAIYAGEFEAAEGEQDGVRIRILATEGKRASMAYALDAAKRILAYYNRYFGTRYPLPKLDLVAVPNAFASFSAMENWGCITYIDTALLYDPAASPQSRRERVFEVVAHEMAHQWFGDLVTMAWWDNLWLNEGFASWMGTKCSDALNPEWQLWVRANAVKESAMSLDAHRSTHPILRPIANESQAEDAFDTISYNKGQSLLRMLEAYLGADTFRDGIRRYLTAHQYSNTTTGDLWTALGEASGRPVAALATGWTEQPGFPVVAVSAQGAGAGRTLRLEPSRFVLNDPQAAPLAWKIPVTLANTADLPSVTTVLLDGPATVPFPAGPGAPKLNVGDTGYYRVLYDDNLTAAVRAQITTLPVADQLNLLADTWALVQAGRVPASAWLDLAVQLGGSRSQPVWRKLLDVLGAIDRLEVDEPGRRAYDDWAVRFLGPQLARLGWSAVPGESPLDSSLRGDLIGILGRYGDPAVVAECTPRFAAFLRDPSTLPGELRGPVLTVVGRYATRATYEQLHAQARAARTTEDKRRFYGAMQAALDPDLARTTLALSLGDEMSTSESTSNVAAVAANEHAALAWDFAREHLDALLRQMTSFGSNNYIPGIMASFTDARRADELEAYVRQHSPPDALAEAAKTADLIRLAAAVKRRELPGIEAWVTAHAQPSER